MELLGDIGLFLLFLLEYAAYLFAAWKLYQYAAVEPSRMLSLRYSQLVIALSIAHVAFSLLLLARVFSPLLLGLLLAAYELAVVVALVVRAIVGGDVGRPWLFGLELAVRHRIAMVGGQAVVGIVGIVCFPIAVGIAYFSLEKGSDELLFWVIALTVGSMLVAVVWQLGVSTAALLSKYLGDDVRTQIFVNQLMTVPQIALWLAIAFWSRSDGEAGIGEGETRQFVLLMVVLVGFIVIAVVIPYVIGALRARRSRTELMEREQRTWKRLAETADIPMSPAYESDVNALRDDIGRERTEFETDHESFFELLEALQGPDLKQELKKAGVGIPAGLDEKLGDVPGLDPRLAYRAMLVRIEEAANQLSAAAGDSSSKELADSWAKVAHRHRREAAEAASAERKARGPARAAVGLTFSTVLGLMADQFGALIADELSTLAS